MSEIKRALNSCGIKEYQGMDKLTPEDIMADVWEKMVGENGAYITFSNKTSYKNVKALGAYIKEHKLGKTVFFPRRKNPNSGNNIDLLVWYYDQKVFTKWREKNPHLFPESLVGQKYIVIGNTCGHSLGIGDTVTCTKNRDSKSFHYKHGWYINLSDVKPIE